MINSPITRYGIKLYVYLFSWFLPSRNLRIIVIAGSDNIIRFSLFISITKRRDDNREAHKIKLSEVISLSVSSIFVKYKRKTNNKKVLENVSESALVWNTPIIGVIA